MRSANSTPLRSQLLAAPPGLPCRPAAAAQSACCACSVLPNSPGALQCAMHALALLWAFTINHMSWGLTPPYPPHRTDLEKAVAAHGGQGVVAAALGWPLKVRHRRPKGYWDDLANVRAAIDEFIGEQGMEAGECLRGCMLETF